MVELDRQITSEKSIAENWNLVLDLERLVPCVQGGTVKEKVSDDEVKAEIHVKMGSMSMRFSGTVTIVDRDAAAHTARLRVKSREIGGSGQASAEVTFTLNEGGGTIHTSAQVTGKAASMGEATVATVLDALVKNFADTFSSVT